MSTPRKLGVFLCVLGFAAVCVLALTMSTGTTGFNGLPGMQKELANEALVIVAPVAPNAEITAEGRDLTVQLPDVVPAGFDRDGLLQQLEAIDGVRKVTMIGDPPSLAAEDDPVPTAAPATPEPEATQEPEPTPEPTEVPAPALADVVADLNLEAIEFEAGTAELSAVDRAVLDDVAVLLQGQTGGPIQVQAHTDNVGDPDVNLLLSQDRADAVVEYLLNQGVDSELLTAQGYGASQPIADNSTEQGRADNQRVELVVGGN